MNDWVYIPQKHYDILKGMTRFANIWESCHTDDALPYEATGTLPPDTEWNKAGTPCFGTYMHGILDNPVVVDHLLKPFAETVRERTRFDYAAYKEEQYALLAAATRRYTDMDTLYSILRGNTPTII